MLLIYHRLKAGSHRGMTIEYTLIALLIASAAFQVWAAIGVKAV